MLGRQPADQHWHTYRIYTPAGGKQKPDSLHELLSVLWGRALRSRWARLTHGQPWLCYEVRSDEGNVHRLWSAPEPLTTFVRESLALYRPGAVEEFETDPQTPALHIAAATLQMKRPVYYPLAERAIGGPLERAMATLRPTETALVQFLLAPRHDAEWRHQAHEDFRQASGQGTATSSTAEKVFDGLNQTFFGWTGSPAARPTPPRSPSPRLDAVERHRLKETPAKLLDHGFRVVARVITSAPTQARAHTLLQGILAQFTLLDDANQVKSIQLRDGAARRLWDAAARRETGGPTSLWTCQELASVVDAPGPVEEQSGIIELHQLPPKGEIIIGEGVYRGRRVPIALSRWALFQHLLIQGKTGSGKGVIQIGAAIELARAGLGFSIFFPLQQDAQKLMAALPEEALARTIFFEVGHPRWALPLNILKHDGTPEDQERVAEEALNLLVRLFGADAIQARSRMILRAALAGAAAMGGHLGDAERVLVDDQYRAKAAARVPNENTRRFLADWKPGADRDAPLNKLAALTWSGPIAAMVAQPDALDWVDVIRSGKIVIASLNQEQAGELACNMAAGGILNQMIRAVKSIPPSERADLFHLALFDEFRIVADNNEALWQEGFTQLRQFKFGIGVAGQYPSQLPAKVWQSVAGSVANKIVLFEEGTEADACARLLGQDFAGSDLARLPSLQGYANVLFAGAPAPDGRIPLTPSGPFTFYAPSLTKPVRDWEAAAEASMATWCRSRRRNVTQSDDEPEPGLDID